MTGPLVSILIPAYNAQRWVGDTIESALAQTWRKTEIIVVDDGSSDQTLTIARQFASATVCVVAQTNQGAAAARNTAYSICQGDYIQWLDADDLLECDKIEQQLRTRHHRASSRTLLSGAWANFRYRTSKAVFSQSPLWRDLSPVEWLLLKLGCNLYMQTDNWLVSRELSIAAGPWDSRLSLDDDGEYFCRVMLASDGIHFVPQAKSYYRQAGFNCVSYIGESTAKLESLFLSMQLHMRYLRSLEDSERSRLACTRYIRTWLHEFYPARLDLAEELQRMTAELGGHVAEPRLSWKYDWIVRLFGWGPGRQAQRMMPRLKASSLITWDRAISHLESRRHAFRLP
jgi:glycosyltransferase involved in cell wall biosynthesis